MLKTLFDEYKDSLSHFFDLIDLKKVEELLNRLLACKGSIIFSGVGKSGFIAEKLSKTLLSTGTRSFHLQSQDALHGDIALLSKDDILILLSKSGDTEELLKLVPFAKKRGVFITALVSNSNSKLAKEADFHITLPCKKELCPFNLAPTTSSALQLIFGDILAVALMKHKKFTEADFAGNHPSGTIGKKTTILVKDLMLKGEELPLISPQSRVIDVLAELSSKKCGCLIVVEKMHLRGIFTDGDLRRAIESDRAAFINKTISSYMNSSPKWISEDELAYRALAYMEEGRPVTALPVLRNLEVVGLIRLHDIVQKGLN